MPLSRWYREPTTFLPLNESIKETPGPAAKTSSPVQNFNAKFLLNDIRATTPQIKARLDHLYEISSWIFDGGARCPGE